MASTLDRVVATISKPPGSRSERDVSDLLPWFRKKSELFRSLKIDVVADIIKNCEISTRTRDKIIIKQGDVGDCFYIILRGKVSIYINNAISDEEDENKLAEHSNDSFYTDQGELDRSKFGNFIAPLDDGKSFGELALINTNCIRNASIISDEVTLLLVVNRALYNRSLKAAQTADIDEKNRFVSEHPLFQNWALKYKRQLVYSLRKERTHYEATVVRQGEIANVIYFLLRGQAKIIVDPMQHKQQYPQFYPLIDPQEILAREELDNDAIVQSPRKKEVQTSFHDRPLLLPPSAQRRREIFKKPVEVSVIGTNEIIGDLEFAADLKTYLQTVECSTICDTYALDMKNYERLITKRNPKTAELLRQSAEVKLACRVARLQGAQVPLLRTLLFKMECLDRQANPQKAKRASKTPTQMLVKNGDVVPQRGPLIDQFGPGTVFYRTKMRENAKKKLTSKAHFRGARMGFTIPMTSLAPASLPSHVISDVVKEDEDQGQGDEPKAFLTKASSTEDVAADDKDEGPFGVPRRSSIFKDFESSDRALTILEEKIKAWHSTIPRPNPKLPQPSTFKLRRVNLEKGREVIPGRQVVMRKRKPHAVTFDPNANSDDEELHVSTERSHGTPNQGGHHMDKDAQADSGAPKTAIHRGRIQGVKEETALETALNELPREHMNVAMLIGMYTNLRSPDSDSDLSEPDRAAPPPESKGTILDILSSRQPENLHQTPKWTLNRIRQMGMTHTHGRAHTESHHNAPLPQTNNFTLPVITSRFPSPPLNTMKAYPFARKASKALSEPGYHRLPPVPQTKGPSLQRKHRRLDPDSLPAELPTVVSLVFARRRGPSGGGLPPSGLPPCEPQMQVP